MSPDDPAQRAGGFLVSKIHQIGGRIFARLLKEKGDVPFNPSQGRILFALWREDALSIGALSKATALEPSTLTSMLDRLEAQGLLRRESDPGDRRITIVRRSDADKALEASYAEVSREMSAIFYRGMGEEEIAALESTLERILANLEEVERGSKS